VASSREVLLKRFRDKIDQGLPIIGGAGISAKFEEAGGIDLIVIYKSGRFRMAGHASLAGLMPFGDANQIVLDMANEVLPVVKRTPVLAGVCGVDPMPLDLPLSVADQGDGLCRRTELPDRGAHRRHLPRQP
jgi:predicted TIM-barrel enzyme